MRRFGLLTLATSSFVVAVGILSACGSTTNSGADGGSGPMSSSGGPIPVGEGGAVVGTNLTDAGLGPERLVAPIVPDGSCQAVIASPDVFKGDHVPEGTVISYDSNPPSSGPHYPIWANFQEFSTPVPAGYFVHSEEHGAVILLYNCSVGDAGDAGDAGDCTATLEGLRAIRDALPDDPLCDPDGSPPVRVRIVITPDPDLDVPVAAASWGWTYRAQCFERSTLEQFVHDHYGQGTEFLCAPGKTSF